MRPRSLPLLLAGAGLLVVGGSALYALEVRRAPEPTVADLLDRIVQPRFQRDDDERFGMDRLVKLRAHAGAGRFYRLNPAESALLASANALNRDYLVGFVRVPESRIKSAADAQADFLVVSSRSVNSRDTDRRLANPTVHRPELEQSALALLPEARKHGSAHGTEGQWSVSLRVVRAAKGSCLGCHKGARQGDVLGVMVYAVGREAL